MIKLDKESLKIKMENEKIFGPISGYGNAVYSLNCILASYKDIKKKFHDKLVDYDYKFYNLVLNEDLPYGKIKLTEIDSQDNGAGIDKLDFHFGWDFSNHGQIPFISYEMESSDQRSKTISKYNVKVKTELYEMPELNDNVTMLFIPGMYSGISPIIRFYNCSIDDFDIYSEYVDCTKDTVTSIQSRADYKVLDEDCLSDLDVDNYIEEMYEEPDIKIDDSSVVEYHNESTGIHYVAEEGGKSGDIYFQAEDGTKIPLAKYSRYSDFGIITDSDNIVNDIKSIDNDYINLEVEKNYKGIVTKLTLFDKVKEEYIISYEYTPQDESGNNYTAKCTVGEEEINISNVMGLLYSYTDDNVSFIMSDNQMATFKSFVYTDKEFLIKDVFGVPHYFR